MAAGKTLVLIGSGPGVGVATASLFASKGFNVALLSRNADRLKEDATAVKKSASGNVKIETFPVDVSDHAALKQTLEKTVSSLGAPEIVVYNAARVGPSTFGEFTADEMISDFKINSVGLYTAATWALPHLEKAANEGSHPSFFLSGSGVNYQPFAPFFSLSMSKASQSNFLKSYDQIAGPKGVHVARVDINGIVDPKDSGCTPGGVAQQHWKLYQQDKNQWEHVVNVADMKAFTKAMGIEWQSY